MAEPDKELIELLRSPTTSYRVQALIPHLLEMDPVDAANEIEHLSQALQRRLDALLAEALGTTHGETH